MSLTPERRQQIADQIRANLVEMMLWPPECHTPSHDNNVHTLRRWADDIEAGGPIADAEQLLETVLEHMAQYRPKAA